ncbi:MAG: hypothetical protein HY332_01375 [Chloroflexi bacterium]|nr:hypothetical protein [Chloroflexota bacterium]
MSTSYFSWLDYSEHERRKTLDVINLFREQDTRDELGLGAVRNGMADLLFPGTSTIQTRAKYFLLIPWIHLRLEQRRVPSAQVASYARGAELQLISVLASSDDNEGVIGIQAGKHLQRLPSNVYWQGLGQWGIRIYPGSQDQYYRSLDSFYASAANTQRDDDGEPVEGRLSRNWHAGLPAPPPEFPAKVSLSLSADEAEYLRERLLTRAPGTLLAFLVDRGRKAERTAFPWSHHQLAEFPARIQEQLEHAQNFSEMMWGAALLYNLMLARLAERPELVEDYEQWLAVWSSMIEERQDALRAWDRSRFWDIVASGGARVTPTTRAFAGAWMERALLAPGEMAASLPAQRLIHDRERALKRGQARLDNRRALENWGGAAGSAQLTFRWPVAQRKVDDILTGLDAAPAAVTDLLAPVVPVHA